MDTQPPENSPVDDSRATSAVATTPTDSAVAATPADSGVATTTADSTLPAPSASAGATIETPTTNATTTEAAATTTSTVPKEDKPYQSPIDGYQDLPVVSLDEAIEQLVPFLSNIKDYVATAKTECKKDSNILTLDESAAVYLHTMATPFVYFINEALQMATRAALKPWLSYLKLFITAVDKLPSQRKTLRGSLSGDDVLSYPIEDTCTWWHFTSCSTNVKMAQYHVVQDLGTVLAINAMNAKDISKFSAFPGEEEVVLSPGTKVKIVGEPFSFKNAFSIVNLEEQGSTAPQ